MAERRNATDEVAAAPVERAAIVGCGVIGAAWAARMRLSGVDVTVFDPAPNAEDVLAAVFANAREAWDELGLLREDTIGSLTMADSIEAAVVDAQLVQESVPERLDLKQSTLAAISAAAPTDVLIGSSTSGLKCTDMARDMADPSRLVVAHPFNPVYLLPLVEIVGGEATSDDAVQQAMGVYRFLGMKPLKIRKEIDAHVADRLLEAIWRECLWLVKDGIATTEEIDDAIRYGFGLRFAQMGIFETYRIAGGEGGFGHFMRQFGPALEWPWTKLMDVPEMTDAFADELEAQSDDQSGAYELRELERIRDKNLTSMMLALEANEWGAGNVVAEQRDRG